MVCVMFCEGGCGVVGYGFFDFCFGFEYVGGCDLFGGEFGIEFIMG